MSFREYVEQRLDEAVVNVAKTFDLAEKLKQKNINLDNIFEDGAKIIGYVTHLNAADGNAAQAAKTLNVSPYTLHKSNKQNALADYNIPYKFWSYE